jgi:fumarate reductase flavoprotein subunit
MSPKSNGKNQKLEADLVIVGGGGGGLAAALTAAESGIKNIIVLEKRAALGGNSALASGPFACESPAQARQHIIADKDELFKRTMDWAHWSRVNPRIIRAFLNKSGDTIRWLENMGLVFNVISFFPNQTPRVQHRIEGRGIHLIRVLADKCRELGVQIFLKTGAKELLLEKDGSVSGVLAVGKEELEIRTDSVIIATGGFAGNKRLLKKYCPLYYEGFSLRGLPLTGDGLIMAQQAGAAIEDFVTLLKEGPRVDPHIWPLMGLELRGIPIWVNSRGERFTNETIGVHAFEAGNTILMQPGKVMYALLDSSIKGKVAELLPDEFMNYPPNTTIKDQLGEKLMALDKALLAESAKDRVKIADSWYSIAEWIGADPATLKATVDEYNEYCDHGYDALFAKDRRSLLPLHQPPYYAIRCKAHILDTIGGIRINEHMEVLNSQDRPISGLYAVGVAVSGWESETYCSDLNGSAFGFALNSGRIASENAAALILKTNNVQR